MDAATLTVIFAGIGTILSALAAAVAFLFKQNAKIQREQIAWKSERIAKLENDAQRDEEKIASLERRIAQLEKEGAVMEARFMAFRSSHDSSPLPMWIKDAEGKVLACNKAYETVFLKPRGYTLADYLGHYDRDVWPDHIADQFARNDHDVLANGVTIDTTENVTNAEGKDLPVRIIKYPRCITGIEAPIGAAGIAVIDDLSGIRFNSH